MLLFIITIIITIVIIWARGIEKLIPVGHWVQDCVRFGLVGTEDVLVLIYVSSISLLLYV